MAKDASDLELSAAEGGTLLRLWVQPGASRTGLVGAHGGALKVAVAAPPEAGRATGAALEALAVALAVRPTGIALLSGETSREKRVLVRDLGPDFVRVRLARALSGKASKG